MASWWQKTLLAVAGAAGFAGGAYFVLTRRPLAKKKGTVRLRGLHAGVEIITDRYGVPHIYAQNEEDVFFAQGYMHAQERLWQMEMNRRIGSGRLSEIFGDIAVEADRFARRLGLHRDAAEEVARLPEESRRVLQAYANGVNAFIERNNNRLPLEFTLLRFKPEPWHIADSIQWSKMMGWNLGGNWETEVIRALLVNQLGPELAARLEAGYDPRHPLIVPPGVEYGGVNAGMLEQYERLKQLSGFGLMGASNNWVVDGTMTVTGSPILCNDPHLGQTVPSIWYECHLVAGDIDVVGVSFPGTPGVVIGHNQHIAWGVTNAISDIEDLYIEKFNPLHPNQYEYQGKWEEAQVIREVIQVKGKEPIIEEVRVTRHGPILTSMPRPQTIGTQSLAESNGHNDIPAELPLALRWTGQDHCNIITAILKLDRASNWEEFRDAMRDWDVPPQNVVYADQEGNIGYIMAGAIPIRAQGQGLLPAPGWTGEYEWTGFIPFEELPQTYNPEQHFIVTANNRVVGDDYPYYITNEWLNGYRAQRIRDLLLAKTRKGKLSLSDMAAIQADQYAIPAEQIVPRLLQVQPESPLASAALYLLRTWDYVLSPRSTAAAIYSTTLYKLEHIVFSAILSDVESRERYLGLGSTLLNPANGYLGRSKPLLIRLLKEHNDAWFAHSAIVNGPKTWDAAISRAFHAAVEELREKLGDDISRWQYGKIHQVTYNHPLGMVKPLDTFFNRGPFPLGGDIDTVNVGATPPSTPEAVITVASFRQIVNLADMKASLSIHSPGQSGQPADRHFDDFIKPWLNVEHHPMLFERGMIEANAEGKLELQPEL
ncbi:MAG TPA: penicillin acylase family protein [Ktedonobacteraceae bacterium]|nr:penicillin acylase family protein [Ktedonobacteraceae bacterium]